MTKLPDDDLKRSKHVAVVSNVLKYFKGKLYRCICWLIVEVTSLSFTLLSILLYFLLCSSLLVLDSSDFSIPRLHI